jgi:hypothetical protein
MDITQALTAMVETELEPKTFASGSKGFYATGKTTVDGQKYQCSAQAVLVGSKDNPKVKVTATKDEVVTALTALVKDGLEPRTFKSGNTGHRVGDKIHAGGQKFQASAQAVAIKAKS